MSNKEWDKHIQVGCVVRIREEKRNAKRTGLTLNSYHKIVEPEGNFINTHMQVFVKAPNGRIIGLPFWEFLQTPFTEIPGSARRRRRQ